MMEVKYVCWMDVCLHSNQTSTNAWTPSVCPLHAAKGIRPYIQGYQFSRCRLIYSCVRWQINMGPCGQRCNSLRRHAEGLIGEERECWDFISHLTTLLPSLLKFQGTNVKKKKKRGRQQNSPTTHCSGLIKRSSNTSAVCVTGRGASLALRRVRYCPIYVKAVSAFQEVMSGQVLRVLS